MRFRLQADFVFEAKDLTDARRMLAAHFLRESASDGAEPAPPGRQGYLLIAPAEEDEETNFSDA
jgi:hypothetical protein